ncbi:MAG: hypothetical protein ACRDY0_04635 [Acidimicrobiales bacterium]
MIGFALGYVIGTRAGEEGWHELVQAWKTISSSEEVKELLSGGFSVARDFLSQGAGIAADRLSHAERPGGLRAA